MIGQGRHIPLECVLIKVIKEVQVEATYNILVVRAAVSVLVMVVMMVRSGVVVFLVQR